MILGTHTRHALWLAVFLSITLRLGVTIFLQSSPMSAYGTFGDESVMSVGAERILHGQIPHRDFYSFVPGTAYYPLAGWFLLFGDSYTSLRLFNLMTALGISVALFFVTRRFSSWSSIIPSVLFAVFIFPIWPFVSYHWQFLFFSLCATAILTSTWSRKKLVLAGMFMALAGTSLITKATLMILPQLLYIMFRSTKHERLMNLLWFGLGLLSSVAIFVLPMMSGMAGPLWQQTITNNLTYYQDLVRPYWFVFNPATGYLAMTILVVSLPLCLKKTSANFPRIEYALLVGSHSALALSILYFLEPIHVLQISLFFLVACTVATSILVQSLLHAPRRRTLPIMTLFVIIWVSLAWGYGLARSQTDPKRAFASSDTRYTVSTPKGKVYLNSQWRLPLIQELPVVQYLLSTSLASKRIFFFPFTPGYYYFFERQNPTRLDLLLANHLPQGEQVAFLNQLHTDTDAIVYFPRSWRNFHPDGPLMALMQKEFPITTSFLEGKILVLTRSPLEE